MSSPVRCDLSHGYFGVGLCITETESDRLKDELSFLFF